MYCLYRIDSILGSCRLNPWCITGGIQALISSLYCIIVIIIRLYHVYVCKFSQILVIFCDNGTGFMHPVTSTYYQIKAHSARDCQERLRGDCWWIQSPLLGIVLVIGLYCCRVLMRHTRCTRLICVPCVP